MAARISYQFPVRLELMVSLTNVDSDLESYAGLQSGLHRARPLDAIAVLVHFVQIQKKRGPITRVVLERGRL